VGADAGNGVVFVFCWGERVDGWEVKGKRGRSRQSQLGRLIVIIFGAT